MQNKLFFKWLSSVIATILIFTSIPFADLVVNATENTKIEREEAPSPTNQGDLSTITSGEAPPFQNTDSKEVVELRTESTRVIDNGDGTFTMQMFQEPISRKSDGKWKEIQPELKIQKASRLYATESTNELATKNTLLDIRFAPVMSKNKYAALSYKGHTLTYTFLEASGENGVEEVKDTDATYEDNRVFYKEVIPGLTIRNIVFDESVKEDIILSKYNGTNAYHFFIETDLIAKIEDNGSIVLRDQKNEIIYTLPKPYMTDSNINPESAEPQRSEDVHFELKKENNGYSFTVVANEEWLKDPERIYPVYIDPTTKVQADQDASVSSAYPNANYGTDWDSGLGASVLKAGNYSAATGENFAYVKTPTPSLPYATIETAIFNIYNLHSYYPETKTGIWLDRVNGAWDDSTITWNNKPASSLFTSTSVYKGNWATFNVKNAVNDWIKGTTPNNGFKLHTNGNGQTFWKKFYSNEHSVLDYRPHLNIAYFYESSPNNLAAKTYSLGNNTGYIDLQWDKVDGASSYNVWIFDGKDYKSINVGNKTNWSTKDKSVWPKIGTNLPVNPQDVYKASGGTSYIDRTNYAISVSAVFANGEGPKANPIVPTIPDLKMPTAPKGVAYSNQIGTNSGYVNLEWDEVPEATGYKVWVFNGLSYEPFDVGAATNWTTQNEGIWPTAEEIKNGDSKTLKLHQDSLGLEFPVDPSPLYAKMGEKYANSKNYFFRLSAYNEHGESVFSNDTFITKVPQGIEFLGAEDFWTMIGVTNGTVNAATGNLLLSESDITISGNGPDLGIGRTYNSQSTTVGLFGKGWHSDAEMSIVPKGNDAKFTDEDGTIHLFKKIDKTYKAPTGVYLELTETADQYELKAKDQTVYYFSKDTGKLLKIMDGHKNSIEYLFANNELTIKESFNDKVKNATAREINIVLNSDGLVEKITDPLHRSISFAYNQDLLEKVTDSSGKVTQYEYNENKDLLKLYEATHSADKPVVTQYEYLNNRLYKVTDPENNVYSLDYDQSKKQLTLTKPNNKESQSEEDKNKQVQYTFNEAGNPVQHVDDIGVGYVGNSKVEYLNLTTSYVYKGNNLTETKDPMDQGTNTITETYKYQDGNLTDVIDSYGTETYQYNDNNDVISVEDIEGRTTLAYDGLNQVSETDQSGKVSSMSKYDKYGNVVESSTSLSSATNLLDNNSFEQGKASWTLSQKNVDVDHSSIDIDTNGSNGLNGKNTLKLNVKSDPLINNQHGYIAATQEIAVKPEETYTLSGKVKTKLIQANTLFNVEFLDSNNKEIAWQDNRYSKLAGERPWTERQLTFTTPPKTAKIRIYLEVEHNKGANASGVAWFDAVQLEKTEVSSSFNPILNSSFENSQNNSINNWTGTGGSIDSEESAFDGKQSLKIERTSSSQEETVYKQTIEIGQTPDDKPIPITLTGLSKATDVKVNESGNESYSISATAHYTDKTSKVFTADFPIGTQEWNRSAINITGEKAISEIDVSLIFKGSYTGTVWFDAIRLIEGSIVTKNIYDNNGYLKETKDELGYTTSDVYDTVGNKLNETDANGAKKDYKYDLSDRLEQLLLPNGTSINYTYDNNGNMSSKSIIGLSNKNQKFEYEYDSMNRVKQIIGPLGDITTNDYDSNGRRINTTLPEGNTVQWTYDRVDRVASISYDNERYYTFEYDKNGNEKFVSNLKVGGKKERIYDSSNRVTTQNDRSGTQLWNYPKTSDKLESFTFTHEGFTQTNNYKYNKLDQNTSVKVGTYTYRFDYDEKGNVQTFSTGNNVGATFSYDDRDLVSNLTVGTSNGTEIISEKYSYDANGNRKKIEFADASFVSYDYDNLDQLTSETLQNGTVNVYEYDDFGNRTTVEATTKDGETTSTHAKYNIANQLKQFGNETIDYDDNGNRVKDSKYVYEWNSADQLVSVTKSGETTPFVTYQYNEDGKRIQKNVSGTIINYHYDGDSLNVLYETDGKNNVVRSYTYSESGQMLSMKKGSQTYFYHYNAHGDVVALTDINSQVVATYRYDAWGNVLNAEEADQVKDNPYRYAGYQYDHETGLYYLIARYHHPEHGVFLSLDPDPGDSDDILTQNGYTYANNNPVMMVDPDGHAFWLVVNAGFAAYDGYKAYKTGKGWKYVVKKSAMGAIGGGKVNFIKKGAKFHSNNKKSTKIQHGYEISNKDGNVVKVGVSSGKIKNGKSVRAENQVKTFGSGYGSRIVVSNVRGRSTILNWERNWTNKRASQGHNLYRHKLPVPKVKK